MTTFPLHPSVHRLWRGQCRGRASVTECQAAAPLRPAGCSCQSSVRSGTTWRRSTTGPWKWISSGEPGTARPVGGPSPTPSTPSRAKSWSTWKTPRTTAWRTARWACRAPRAASASRRARDWASGRSGAARGCAESAGWPWRSARPRWCPAATASSTGAARSSATSAGRRWPSTSAWRGEAARGEGRRAPAAAGRASGWGRGTESTPRACSSFCLLGNLRKYMCVFTNHFLSSILCWEMRPGTCTELCKREDCVEFFYKRYLRYIFILSTTSWKVSLGIIFFFSEKKIPHNMIYLFYLGWSWLLKGKWSNLF